MATQTAWAPPTQLTAVTCRLLDLLIAIPSAILILPFASVTFILVRVTSKGPGFYRALRVGQFEKPFTMYKFRTMEARADEVGAWRTADNDPRITAFGAFLRKTSLDELPQLANVLSGEMSLVGPRPAAFAQLEEYSATERTIRSSVLPGLTGLAQVSGRSSLTPAQGLKCDIHYAQNRSVALNIKIMAKTLRVVFSRRGSN